jgi:5-histidylcysteine sulfoxide synthase/putative 4-mercaptohistidine N1-methyltranferase
MLWPSVDEVREYRHVVYNTIVDLIENHPDFETISQGEESPFWAIVMGTEHEKIHLETSSVLMRELPLHLVRTPEHFPAIHKSKSTAPSPETAVVAGEHYPVNEFISVQGGKVTLGKPREFPSYGWDNEYGNKTMTVKPFRATKYMISNGEFLQFVKSGGYVTKSHWEDEGWQWRCFRNVKWPTFWVPSGPSGFHQYQLRTNFEVIDMPWDWPALVNYHEAKAYANWRSEMDGKQRGAGGYRILTEAEHNIIRDESLRDESLGVERDFSMTCDGHQMLERGANLNLAVGSETPVDLLKPASTGFHDVMGNAWEWCEDHMSAFPGFKVHPFYNDFTLPCFDGEHNLILGGSFMSAGDEASVFARFHFRPHFFQHSGFRLVEPNQDDPTLITSCMDNQGPFAGNNPFRSSSGTVERKYAEDETLRQYIHLHFNSAADKYAPNESKDYCKKLADWVVSVAKTNNISLDRMLDAGCGVGGVAFNLSRDVNEVLGLDISSSLIRAANQIKAEGVIPYHMNVQGDIVENLVATLPDGAQPDRVSFKQADVLCISPDTGVFDGVVIANVIDRLLSPSSLLARMGGPHGLVKKGGLLIVSSPFSWVEQFTPKDLWIGGHAGHSDADHVFGPQALANMLSTDFDIVDECELPIVLCQHSRQYEYVTSYVVALRHK